MRNLTIRQLLKICQENKFVLLRDRGNQVYGVNCNVAPLISKHPLGLPDQETKFYSWQSCTFNEYINLKLPFVSLVEMVDEMENENSEKEGKAPTP